MSALSHEDVAMLVGNLVLENTMLQKQLRALAPTPPADQNGHVDLADLPQPTSGAERAATREEG